MQDLPQEVLNSLAAAGSSQLSSKQLAVKLNADHQKVVGAIKSLGTNPLNYVHCSDEDTNKNSSRANNQLNIFL